MAGVQEKLAGQAPPPDAERNFLQEPPDFSLAGQSRPLQGRKPAFFQAADRRICDFFVFVVLGPLLMFTPAMARAKRKGLADYGLLAQKYVRSFERKWVLPNLDNSEELLGAADIQSLADLGNSYSLVRDMRAVPFGLEDITRLATATAAPLLPLLLTIFSPEELIMRIVKIVF